MVLSKCGSCGGNSFGIAEQIPLGTQFKILFVQCNACGVPIGVTTASNVNKQINDLNARMDKLDSLIKTVNQNIQNIAQRLGR